MDKLSGILPTNARISNVDLASGPAVRPGAPSFGRPIGLSPKTRLDRLKAQEQAFEASQIEKMDKIKISPQAMELSKAKEALDKAETVTVDPTQVLVDMKPVVDKNLNQSVETPGVDEGPALELPQELHDVLNLETPKTAEAESDLLNYPEETRDLLNKTSIIGRIVNNIPEATDSLIKSEDEEV